MLLWFFGTDHESDPAREPSQRPGDSTTAFNTALLGTESTEAITGDGTWALLGTGVTTWNATYQSLSYYTATVGDPLKTLLITKEAYDSVADSTWERSGNAAGLETDILAAAGEDYADPEIPGWSDDYPYYASTPQGPYDAKPATPFTLRVPAGIVPPEDNDGHVAIEQPDGTVVELYACIALSTGQVVCANFAETDLTGHLDGRRNGVRASMVPNFACVITQRDVNRVEQGTPLPIDHALSVVIPEGFLANHLDPEYPGIAHDSGGSDGFGNVRMGDRLILPASFDETGALSVIGEAMMVAARDYGVYVTDRGGGGVTWHVELTATDAEGHLQAWHGNLQSDLDDMIDALVLASPAPTTIGMRADGTAAGTRVASAGLATVDFATAGNCIDVTDHNSLSFVPGDIILVSDQGGEYRTMTQADIADDPMVLQIGVTYTADGTPIIEAGTRVVTWVLDSGSIYVATVGNTTSQATGTNEMLWQTGVALDKEPLDTDLSTTLGNMTAGTFYFDQANNDLYCWATDSADPDTHTMHFCPNTSRAGRTEGIATGGTVTDLTFRYGGADQFTLSGSHDDWVFTRVTFTKSSRHGLRSFGAADGWSLIDCIANYNGQSGIGDGSGIALFNAMTNLTVDGCTIHDNDNIGITLQGAVALTNTIVKNCTVYNNGDDGIGIAASSSGVTIEYNTCYNNGSRVNDRMGIHVFGPSTIVRYNVCYGNGVGGGQGHGIQIDTDGNNSEVYYNICYENNDGGISFISVSGVEIYNNVCYGNLRHGINNGGAAPDAADSPIIKNNILAQNEEYQLFLPLTGADEIGGTPDIDFNCYQAHASQTALIRWVGVDYTLAGFVSATVHEDDGFESDPVFVDPATYDFKLQSTSPCIDTGVDVGLTQDFDGNPVPQ